MSLSLAGACLAAGTAKPYVPVRLWGTGGPDPATPAAEAASAEQALHQWAHQDLVDRVRRGGGGFFPGVDG